MIINLLIRRITPMRPKILLSMRPKPLSTQTVPSSEALIKELNQKLTENRLKNILVYSCEKENGLAINIMGLFAGVLLMGASWSTWHLFSSVRFKKRNIENESGFFKTVLKIIGSEYFKMALCGVICLVGNINNELDF